MLKALIRFDLIQKAQWFSTISRTLILLVLVIISSCTDPNDPATNGSRLLGAGFGINTATLVVNDLKTSRDYYSDTLGFSKRRSDEYKKGIYDGTLTNRISFPDMSTLELMTIEDSLVTPNTPDFITAFLAKYEGVQSYSLSTSSADTTYSWLTSQAFVMDSVQSYRTSEDKPKGWSWDSGEDQERSVSFKNNTTAYFPKLVEDTEADYQEMLKDRKTYYGYYRSFSNHPNGVVGIANLQIAVDDLNATKEQFQKMGLKELEISSTKNMARFQLKRHQELQLVSSSASDDELSSFLQERGTGVFAIRFDVKNLDSTYLFLSEKLPSEALIMDTINARLTVLRKYAYGVQLEFVNEPREQALLAQQLKIGTKLDSVAVINAEGMYKKYCALCHGDNREGYAADNAPSLKSHSLLATSEGTNFLRYTVQYGRAGTAMGGYLDRQGGPMEYIEIELLLQWLYETSGVEEPIELSREPVLGDVELGANIYARNCSVCHGENGEGISAPALGNSMLLATATDEFLKYAIKEGRDGTPMMAYKDILSEDEVNGVTAFLRSRASGWNIPQGDSVTIPTPDQYVLNPNSKSPNFELKEGLYVSAKQVNQALKDSARMIILDARSAVAWRQSHIPGSVPVPYYEEPETFIGDIPNDSTFIVAYCACPHAASGRVVTTLRRYGYKNTAILDEGILVWGQMGFPVRNGR
jgi:mono/diheme cytochrome c family protein/rhodanese-related sulfurtransferase